MIGNQEMKDWTEMLLPQAILVFSLSDGSGGMVIPPPSQDGLLIRTLSTLPQTWSWPLAAVNELTTLHLQWPSSHSRPETLLLLMQKKRWPFILPTHLQQINLKCSQFHLWTLGFLLCLLAYSTAMLEIAFKVMHNSAFWILPFTISIGTDFGLFSLMYNIISFDWKLITASWYTWQ